MNKIKALLSCAVAPAFLLVPASATLQTAQSYFPGLNDNDKDVYTQWLKNKFSSYSRDAFLPSTEDHENGAAVFWDIEEEDISFAVAVRATGWLGFGISEAGGMLGADVVTFQALSLDSSSKEVSKRRSGALPSTELVDSYILEDRAAPLVDDCQDWILKSATTEGGWIIIEMSRKLDTGDKQDRQIRNDADLWNAPTHLISAWGDMDDISNHGSNRARLSVRLFATDSNNKDDSNKSTLSDKLLKHSDGYFDLREDDYEVPQNETTYHHYCKSFDELKLDLNLPQDQSMVTMIGAQPILSEDTASLVHHFVVYSRKDCNFEDFVMPTMVYLWAPGDDGLLLPDDVGFPLFDRDSQQALMIEIHYNNPYGISGKIDSSGVRFYFTYEERDHRAGILQLGDPFVSLEGEEIKSGLTRYEFSCPGICSSSFLGDQKVTVLAESLHMHKSGVRMTNEVIRDSSVVHEAHVDVYEFDQQGSFRVQQDPYEIVPGDGFRTTCYYRDGGKFGLSSQEEMCIAFLFYYPVVENDGYPWFCPYGIDYSVCNQELNSTELGHDGELGRYFGSYGSECGKEAGPSNIPINPTDDTAQDSGCIGWNGAYIVVVLSIVNMLLVFDL